MFKRSEFYVLLFVTKKLFIIVNIRTYLGKKWSSLSANPMNDIKDVSSILHKVKCGIEHNFILSSTMFLVLN